MEKQNTTTKCNTFIWGCYVYYQEVKAKILSAIFVRQIGHSEHASEQDLHTANATKCQYHENIVQKAYKGQTDEGSNLQQKCLQGRSIAAVVDSKHTLHTWEFASPFGRCMSSFSFISCIRAWMHSCQNNKINKTTLQNPGQGNISETTLNPD